MSENADYSYSFDPSDRIRYNGERVLYEGGFREGQLFKKPGVDFHIFLTHAKIIEKVKNGEIKVDRRYYSLSRQKLIKAGNELLLTDVPEDELPFLNWQYAFTLRWRLKRQQIPNGHTTQGGKDSIDVAYQDYFDEQQELSKAGKPFVIFKKPAYSTICNWDATLRANDDLAIHLRDKRHFKSGNFLPKIRPDVEKCLADTVKYYLADGARTPEFCHEKFLIPSVFSLRVALLEKGEPCQFDAPSITTLKKRIAAIDEFVKIACRFSVEEAEKQLRAKGEGLEIVRPGARAEIDGWVFHLHTVLKETDVWASLTPSQISKIKAVRVTVIVVIDTATRSITGAFFSWSENKEGVVGAVRLSLIDKTEIAVACGCESTWPQISCGKIVGDISGAFNCDETTTTILHALEAQQFTLPGRPWLKGRIEAFFRKCAHDFVQFFTGVAWSDPKKRNSSDAQANASLGFAPLRKLFIRWIVDDYHRTDHPSLGMSPLEAWHLLCAKMPPPVPRSKEEISAIFGRIEQRDLSNAGVRVVSNDYHSGQLQKLIEIVGVGYEIDVKIDDLDLGQVSVRIPRGIDPVRLDVDGDEVTRWITVPGPSELIGISMWQMEQADESLLVQFGADPKSSERIRNAARLEFVRAAAEAKRLMAFNTSPGEKLLARSREGFHPGLRFSSAPAPVDEDMIKKMHAAVPTGAARAAVTAAVTAAAVTADEPYDEDYEEDDDDETEIRFASDEVSE